MEWQNGGLSEKQALGLPIYAIKNTAKRWMTTVNYDLLIYEHKVVVARGISWKSTPGDIAKKRWTGRSWRELDEGRVQQVARASAEKLQKDDPGNRLLPSVDIAHARLRRGPVVSRLRLELRGGEQLRFMWVNVSRNADYGEARGALQRLLGAKLTAD